MSILNRKVAGTWQSVATAAPDNNFTGYNPKATLTITSVQSLLASAGLTSQRMIGHTDRTYLLGAYVTPTQRYSTSPGLNPYTARVKNEITGVTTDLDSVFSAAAGGAVTVVAMAFTEGPITPPFWTAHRDTSEVI